MNGHLAQVRECASPLGIRFLGVGASPKWTLAETPIMPKSRYEIMTRYMPKVGGHGLDMMYRTCTIQANLDFADEADMVMKMRVGLALQPIATALFANSPFTEGKPNGFLSWRSEIWLDTDPDRTGMLPFAFEPGFGFERYVDWALDVPMYFVKRGDTYHDVAGASFRDLMAGTLPQLPGERATLSDWTNHLSTLFPEVRLKTYLEMRGADGGPAATICRASGLLGRTALRFRLPRRRVAARQGLDGGGPPGAPQCRAGRGAQGPHSAIGARSTSPATSLALARDGLKRRARRDGDGNDETIHLAPIEEIAASGITHAERALRAFRTEWHGNIDEVFRRNSY